jgi:NADH pyrophosphatase NudC (nudix superfamily)
MTETEANPHRAARPIEPAHTMARFHLAREHRDKCLASLAIHGVLTMKLFVDLKICEGCGSLWYRPSGGATVYCSSCSEKLGEFPSPRVRTQAGGRKKKRQSTAVFLVSQAGAE